VTPSLSGEAVLVSLLAYVSVYALIFSAGTFYIYRLLRAGLDEADPEPEPAAPQAPPAAGQGVTPSRPLGAAGGSFQPGAGTSAPRPDTA
jgi:cytochrome d ubiquinol oxidase subunit I